MRALRTVGHVLALAWALMWLDIPDFEAANRGRVRAIADGRPWFGDARDVRPRLVVAWWRTDVPVEGWWWFGLGGKLYQKVLGWALLASLVEMAYFRARHARRPRPGVTRAPVEVLYLREFRTDQPRRSLRFTGVMAEPSSLETFDHDLCKRLRGYGRVTAVVTDTKADMPAGPDELVRLEGREWHARVEALVCEAKLVVWVAGASKNLLWELEAVLRRGAAPRLLVVGGPSGLRATWPVCRQMLRKHGIQAPDALPEEAAAVTIGEGAVCLLHDELPALTSK